MPALPALAHAAFVSAEPEPGTQLAAAPGVVTVRFSEPLILELSSMQVVDPDGRLWERSSATERTMTVALDTTSQGIYLVEWKTVSPLDGHTLRGSYRFGVGVTPDDVDPAAEVEPATSDIVLAIARAAEYLGLLVALGMVVIARLSRRRPVLEWGRPRLRVPVLIALIAGVAVVTGEALLAAAGPSVQAVSGYLEAEPGVPRLIRLSAETVAAVAALVGAAWLVAFAVVSALVALAAAGHAAAANPAWWGITVDAVHLVAAGVWAGGIVGMATLRPPAGWQSDAGRELLRRFSPVAVPAFIVTIAFGTLRGAQELAGLRDLVGTSYGQVLLLKVVAVAMMVPLSWRAWRRCHPRPRAESVLAVIAVGAAALLAAYPVPPQRAEEDAAQAHGTASKAFPQQGDLTLAAATGDAVVGLTLRPARPGRNDVLVYLLPSGGPENADGMAAVLHLGDQEHQLQPCGVACRETALVLQGGERLSVEVDGIDDAPATFMLPELPAPDGGPVLERMVAAMDRLQTLRYEEVFGPTDPPIRSTATLVAPDRLRFEVHTHDRVTVRIGETIYRREGDGAWKVSKGPRLDVHSAYIWDYEDKVAARVVGQETLEGTSTRIVSFFVGLGSTPIWYRLWVDDDGLVRRAEMRAQGHFMDHTYFDFNEPISIEPPPDAPSPQETPEETP